jgi:hypothetical protein
MEDREKVLVKVLIPIYKNTINCDEQKSLEQCSKVLSAYPVVFIKPHSLEVENLKKEFPQITVESFPDEYFSSLIAYNRLMLSPEFYSRFSNCKYVLIHQLDAYVFRDELKEWCDKNYDYIGAPWLLKAKYHALHKQVLLQFKKLFYYITRSPSRKFILGDRVGNGGFSLRKVSSHLAATLDKQARINYFLAHCTKHSVFNEDVFWATENPQFMYPALLEALSFSMDDDPKLCFQLNHNKLPFGCHGWSKHRKINFWKDKIPVQQ